MSDQTIADNSTATHPHAVYWPGVIASAWITEQAEHWSTDRPWNPDPLVDFESLGDDPDVPDLAWQGVDAVMSALTGALDQLDMPWPDRARLFLAMARFVPTEFEREDLEGRESA